MALLTWEMICIEFAKIQFMFTVCLTSFRKLERNISESLFLKKWKPVDKENVVPLENFMIPEILRIQNEGFENKNPDRIIRYSKKLKKIFYVIKSQDKTVGYCSYYIKPVFSLRRFKTKSVIYSIAIDKNFRNKGFGGKLLRESIKEMRLNGISSVLLYVNVKNLSAINLYEKIGFRIIQKVKDVCGNCETCFEMELKLVSLLASTFLQTFFAASFLDNDVIMTTQLILFN
jgi:[ribosomal protein S18]-alanine N-acetyltransferase